jgi:hypothetical protein
MNRDKPVFSSYVLRDINVTVDYLPVIAGMEREDIELGFDAMFPYLLVAIFAFGVSEILEVFTFAGAFIEYETESQKQFAMTNCMGIVADIRSLNPDALHARFAAVGH